MRNVKFCMLVALVSICQLSMLFASAELKPESATEAAKGEVKKKTVKPVEISTVTVAIIDFSSKAPGNPELGGQIGDILTARLSVYDQFTLIERQKLDKILKEHEMSLTGMVDTASAVKLGNMLGARIMIFGRAFPVGKQLYLAAKIVSTETGKVKGVMAKGSMEEDLSDIVDDLVGKLATGLEKWAPDLLPKEEKLVNKIANLKKILKGKKLPKIAVVVPEYHTTRRIADPAAETEIIKVLKEVGFTVKEATGKNLPKWAKDFMKDPDRPIPADFNKVDIVVIGEGISEFGARMGGLVSCPARLEVRVISRKKNEILLADHTTKRSVDLSEAIAAKTALQAAGHEMAIKIAEQIAKDITAKKTRPKKGTAKGRKRK